MSSEEEASLSKDEDSNAPSVDSVGTDNGKGQKRPAESEDDKQPDSPSGAKRLKVDEEDVALVEKDENSSQDGAEKGDEDSPPVDPQDVQSGGDLKEKTELSSTEPAQEGTDDFELLDLTVNDNKKETKEDDCDSDKENSGDAPMDLTTKPTDKSPDVITLSDSESDENPVKYTVEFIELSPEEEATRNKIIRKLQTDLRNEEAKLVLLKKIRQSQLASQQGSDISKPSQRLGAPSAPPPLVRGNQQQQHVPSSANKYMPSSHSNARPQQPMRGQVGPPPLVMAPRQQGHHNMSSNHMSGYRSVPQQSAPQPQQPVQTPEQRQAAAKLALRKQLEKTLLQIPPPKPPPPEMNFIPSVGSNEFIMLVGLEEIVKRILDAEQGKPEVKYVFNPFTCCQCNTDFTPVWKRNKPGSKEVICEVCVTSNTKRALKQEHTNRLKSAFVKALQQEQEIEQRLSTQNSSSPSPAASSPVNLSSSYKPSAEQMRQHQNLLQAHQAQIRSLQGFAGPNFPYQMSAASNLQRQILLDMIPAWGKK